MTDPPLNFIEALRAQDSAERGDPNWAPTRHIPSSEVARTIAADPGLKPPPAVIIERELATMRGALEGSRNDTLNRCAFNLAQLYDPRLWEDLLLDAACSTGLNIYQARATIASGVRGATAKPRPAHRIPGNRPAGPVQDLPDLDGYQEAGAEEEGPQKVIWADFWTAPWEENWILEPLILQGGQTVIYSAPKVGKSLLALEIAAALATGHKRLLGVTLGDPINVVYIDHENRLYGDVRKRLTNMGYGPTDDLSHLHYYSLQRFAPLDMEQGAKMLMAAVEEASAELVIIDTVSRTISGEENDNTTWLNWYRHTGKRLKAAGVALMRLDHSGKDETKGQRGGSAKSGDVDLIWSLETVVKDDTYLLRCTDHRVEMPEDMLTLKRSDAGHRVEGAGYIGARDAARANALAQLDATGAPKDIGVVAATEWLRDHGFKIKSGVLNKDVLSHRALGTTPTGRVGESQPPIGFPSMGGIGESPSSGES